MTPSVSSAEWLGCFRRIADLQKRRLFSDDVQPKVLVEGVGAGGDHTLSLDRIAEEIVFDELERLCGSRMSVRVVSEERGHAIVGHGRIEATIVVDPLDGSNNAARAVTPHALSIAVAQGDSFDDVVLGYVKDVRGGDEIVAREGEAPTVNGRRLPDSTLLAAPMVGLEYGTSALFVAAARSLPCETVRMIGSSATALSYVGLGRFDGFMTGWGSRCVDIAAAARIAVSGGATVVVRRADASGGDFDLSSRFQVTAARDRALLQTLLELSEQLPCDSYPF